MRTVKNEKIRQPISATKIYRLMIILTYLVSAFYFIKDISGGDMQGAKIIGTVLGVFTAMLVGMSLLNVQKNVRRLLVAASLVVVVFIVSLTTGSYYSDDYCMYVAVIGLNGLYFKKRFSYVQLVLSNILLVTQFLIYPEKADPLSQFIMCMATFNLAAVTICLLVSRGDAFIGQNFRRAAAAEETLKSMDSIGRELEQCFHEASVRMNVLQEANDTIAESTDTMERNSTSISNDANSITVSCDNVQTQMRETTQSIQALNGGVQQFETILRENRANMTEMGEQMEIVRRTMNETDRVFRELSEQMNKIAAVTGEINKIASNTGLLAVNASIEAARAGSAGKGFAVVAGNVKALAVDSTRSSNEVADVVFSMQRQIDQTTQQLGDSMQAVADSAQTLVQLQKGFDEMTQQFDVLYGSIETQNSSIGEVTRIFDDLKGCVGDMSANSGENRSSVAAITETLHVYRNNISAVIEDNRQIRELSTQMLQLAKQEDEEA